MTEAAERQSERLWILAAAVALGGSVPAVFFGKAVIGVLVIFPAVFAIFNVLQEGLLRRSLQNLHTRPFLLSVIAITVLWVASSLGSIDPQKSLTTWARTLGICGLCYFIFRFAAAKPAVLWLALKTLLITSLLILAWAVFSLYIDPTPFKLFALIKGGQPILIQTLKPYTSVAAVLAPIVAWAGWRLGGPWRAVAAVNREVVACLNSRRGSHVVRAFLDVAADWRASGA